MKQLGGNVRADKLNSEISSEISNNICIFVNTKIAFAFSKFYSSHDVAVSIRLHEGCELLGRNCNVQDRNV